MNSDRSKGDFEKFCEPIKLGVFVRLWNFLVKQN
jgi:hypothetical protein